MSYFIRSRKAHKMALFGTLLFSSGVVKLYRFCRKWGIDSQRSMFFGPAVNEAYKLESKIAIHPRIVIDSYVAEAVIENISQTKYEIVAKDPKYINLFGAHLMPNIPLMEEGVVEQDIDGKYIYNYLHFPENNIAMPNYYLSCEHFIKEIINYCYEQIDNNTQYKIIDKYFYLLRFCQTKLQNLQYEV